MWRYTSFAAFLTLSLSLAPVHAAIGPVTDFTVSKPTISANDLSVTATLTVTNTGPVPGSDVVQLYVSLPSTSELTHPPLMLKAFAKVKDLAPGKSQVVDLKLDKYAVSYWEERIMRWVVEPGEYVVRVGRSSAPTDLVMSASLVLKKRFEWNGL